jgi:hypothetical protein
MCVENSSSCPINYLNYIPSDQPINEKFSFTKINVYGGYIIVSNMNTDGNILVKTDLSEEIPCANYIYKNYLTPPFILEYYYGQHKCKEEIVGKLFDNNYKFIDQYSYDRVYEENGIHEAM